MMVGLVVGGCTVGGVGAVVFWPWLPHTGSIGGVPNSTEAGNRCVYTGSTGGVSNSTTDGIPQAWPFSTTGVM